MKLMYFDDYKLGVVKGDAVIDVSSVVQNIAHTGPHDLINGLIARFAEYRPRLEEAAADRQLVRSDRSVVVGWRGGDGRDRGVGCGEVHLVRRYARRLPILHRSMVLCRAAHGPPAATGRRWPRNR